MVGKKRLLWVIVSVFCHCGQLRPWPPHFKAVSQIAFVIPVRSQSAFGRCVEGRCRRQMMAKNLGQRDSSSVRFESALIRGVAENRN
jgi:hypothetical protein